MGNYVTLIEPMGLICISVFIGMVFGGVWMFYSMFTSHKRIETELDKFRDLYFNQLDYWNNKYVDDDPDERFNKSINKKEEE